MMMVLSKDTQCANKRSCEIFRNRRLYFEDVHVYDRTVRSRYSNLIDRKKTRQKRHLPYRYVGPPS